MSQTAFPKVLDAATAVSQGLEWTGFIPLADCPRVLDLCVSGAGALPSIAVFVRFGLDPKTRPAVQGTLEAVLPVLCQRCLEPMSWSLEHSFQLPLLAGDQIETLALGEDAIEIDARGQVSLIEVIEEECLLSLPMVLKHPVCRSIIDVIGEQ